MAESQVVKIIHDVPALLRSTITTLIAFTIAIGAVTGTVAQLPGIPDDKRTQILAIGAGAIAFGTSLRQVIAWLDKNNTSFGRVLSPAVDNPVDEPADPQDGPPPAGPEDIVDGNGQEGDGL